MVGYKLSKNDWVTPFFVIFRSVREILLVTVFLEHPVAYQMLPNIFVYEVQPILFLQFTKRYKFHDILLCY